MSLQLVNSFESYISIEVFPRRGNLQRYVFHLRYELEGTWDAGELTWPWEIVVPDPDPNGRRLSDEYRKRCPAEIQNFLRHVEYELELRKQRLYERSDADSLVLAEGMAE